MSYSYLGGKLNIFRSKIDICVKFWLPRQNPNPNPNPKYLKNQIFPGQIAPVRGLSCHNKSAQEVSSNCERWGARKDELPAITNFNKYYDCGCPALSKQLTRPKLSVQNQKPWWVWLSDWISNGHLSNNQKLSEGFILLRSEQMLKKTWTKALPK